MIETIRFENFKVLRDTTLRLGRLTLIVGPNGSGKSTVFQALEALRSPFSFSFDRVVSVDAPPVGASVSVCAEWGGRLTGATSQARWLPGTRGRRDKKDGVEFLVRSPNETHSPLQDELAALRVYSLRAEAIAEAATLDPAQELAVDGRNFVVLLDRMRDKEPEGFEAVNAELGRWLPEFDRILFDTPSPGRRAFLLRTRHGQHRIPAADVSQGTLLALAMLALAYQANPPRLLCLEEPDRGIHPRLLRDVRDALCHLAYPEQYGEKREPTQVIATTHSPYMLDLFRDQPEEIVIASKSANEATFQRLCDHPHLEEILSEAPLGDVWYSGVLGGVPEHS